MTGLEKHDAYHKSPHEIADSLRDWTYCVCASVTGSVQAALRNVAGRNCSPFHTKCAADRLFNDSRRGSNRSAESRTEGMEMESERQHG